MGRRSVQKVRAAATTREEAIPAEYATVTKQVVATPATTREDVTTPEYKTITRQVIKSGLVPCEEVVGAEYAEVTKTVLKSAATTREEEIAAEYKTITKQVLKSAASSREEVLPGEYKTITKSMQMYGRGILKAGTGTGLNGDGGTVVDENGNTIGRYCGAKGAYSSKMNNGGNTNDCIYPAYREEIIPATYSTVTKQVIKSAASSREDEIPAEYKTVTKQVVKSAATSREEVIPAAYENKTKQVVRSAATTRETDVPAEYATITKRKLVKQGGVTEWREVLCDSKVDSYTVSQIQAALKSRGYDAGPEDNVMGSRTKAALTQFQKDKGLPVGQLNIETLKALGVKY
jgi:hypothetical protein